VSSQFRIKGGAELLDLLDRIPKRLASNVVRGGIRAAAAVVRDDARDRVRGKGTGRLAKAIKVSSPRKDGTIVSVKVQVKGTDAYVGYFLEHGVAPHEIETKRKMALTIGPDLLRGRVHHPGFPAMPFMRPALDTKAVEAVNAMGAYIAGRLSWDALRAPEIQVVEGDEE
jgi:HK97 gp10 family phage protein